ncbi:MAG: GNAT family N-acetyltransferase [Bacillota bacterium]|nr:GNAT family N-acetyltransferase [Bacillota bacterium]
MYCFEKLNNSNMIYFKELNKYRNKFNNLNKDFFEKYKKANFIKRFILQKQICLLKVKSSFVGYMWITPKNSQNFVINSLNVIEFQVINNFIEFLMNQFKSGSTFSYLCEKNNYNFKILESLGFKPIERTLYLKLLVDKANKYVFDEDVEFEILKRGKQEEIRRTIQNEVFQNIDRLPLSINDIFDDEMQKYYFDKGAVFIKKDNVYLGYGQIIIEDGHPTIVNLGILKEYRGQKYGKKMLEYLINIAICEGYSEVRLKVASDNNIGLNLYLRHGFVIDNESCMWEYKINKI